MLKASFKATTLQGLKCYLPVIEEYSRGKLVNKMILRGDPLVYPNDARKYAQLNINEMYSI
jgi:hypothetical protein